MRIKRIAILYESLGRSKGGIESWIFHASEELIYQGNFVTIFAVQEHVSSDSAVELVKIKKLHLKKSWPIIKLLIKIRQLTNQLRKELNTFDVVWARSFTMANAAINILGRNKVLYINAAPHSFYGRKSFKEQLEKYPGIVGFSKVVFSEIHLYLSYHLEKRAIKNSINVFLSEARRNETIKYFKLGTSVKTKVITAGVDTKRFYPNENIWNGFGTLKLIAVCRLEVDKNVQCVIKAIALLKEKETNVFLTIVGDGSYRLELEKLTRDLKIENNILFTGRQENVEEWYRENNVFVLPSLYEGFGSVYVEAMSSGLPCIAISNKNGKYSVAADEIIEHGSTGFLMEENDENELAKHIAYLYENPSVLHEFSIKGRETAVSKYAWENVVNNLLKATK